MYKPLFTQTKSQGSWCDRVHSGGRIRIGGQRSGKVGLWGRWPLSTSLSCPPAKATKPSSHPRYFLFLKNGSLRLVAPGSGQMSTGVLPNGSGQAQLQELSFWLSLVMTHGMCGSAPAWPQDGEREQARQCVVPTKGFCKRQKCLL